MSLVGGVVMGRILRGHVEDRVVPNGKDPVIIVDLREGLVPNVSFCALRRMRCK